MILNNNGKVAEIDLEDQNQVKCALLDRATKLLTERTLPDLSRQQDLARRCVALAKLF